MATACRARVGVVRRPKAGSTKEALAKAFGGLATSRTRSKKGVGLLYSGKAADACRSAWRCIGQRQRQLTRVPSEIYPVAMLDGQALYNANKFDDAAVAFLAALKQRPSDAAARKYRAEALTKAGKPEAGGR